MRHRITSLSTCLVCLLLWQILILGLGPAQSRASIDDNWDWTGQKRTLKIKIADPNEKLGNTTIKDIIDDAMANWNNAATGWTFQYAGAGDTPDIDVDVATITDKDGNQKNSGGGVTRGFGAKEIKHLDVIFDPDPKEGFDWGTEGADKKNPVVCAKHELSHTIRLDHEGGRRKTSHNILDPGNADTGYHDTTLSDDDKKHATKAAEIEKKESSGSAGGDASGKIGVKEWSHAEDSTHAYPYLPLDNMETYLNLLPGCFADTVNITVSISSGANIPDHWSMPRDYERFVRGMWVVVDYPAIPTGIAQIQIPYFDNVTPMDPALGVGYEQKDLADPDWQPIMEELDLMPVIWNPNEEEWEDIVTSISIDPDSNLARFDIPCSLLTRFLDEDTTYVSCIGIGGLSEEIMGIDDYRGEGGTEIKEYRLSDPVPNPFNGVTRFSYVVPGDGAEIVMAVYDVSGRLVKTVASGFRGPGRHQATWNGTDNRGRAVASGVYFIRLDAPGWSERKRVTLMR
jgi:hypothetical protein